MFTGDSLCLESSPPNVEKYGIPSSNTDFTIYGDVEGWSEHCGNQH